MARIVAAGCLTVALAVTGCTTGGDGGPAATDPADAPTTSTARLDDVDSWLYLIDVNLDADQIDRIVASDHDMVVLDLIPSEANNTDFPMAEVIDRLHAADHPKLVLAYIDTGQAEDYRTYWQGGWEIGDPDWIVGLDPDGWEGNYPVAYWRDEWHDIWLDEDGMLDLVLDEGFDGVYLDWVEAYSDDSVVATAATDGVDPQQEMVWWVADIADHLRARDPDHLVIGQNAAELVHDDEYRATIDAIAQEQVWFDGAADGDPPGDCPLPRTDADIDSEAYEASLTEGCLEQYLEFPDSTLHVSSEEYLEDLTAAVDMGLVVFTVDYAVQPANVQWLHTTSRAYGFVPFVGPRDLDQFIPARG